MTQVTFCVGAVLSPCLSNVYLDRLDQFVDTILIPEYNRGVLRKHNPEYRRVQRSLVPATVAMMPRCGSCASGNAACPAWIPKILATGGCGT
jgi:hypothetical protein